MLERLVMEGTACRRNYMMRAGIYKRARLLSLSRESSSIGAFSEKQLMGFITDFLRETYIPAVNDVLQVGLPLPDFLDMNYNLAELDIVENALVMDLKVD